MLPDWSLERVSHSAFVLRKKKKKSLHAFIRLQRLTARHACAAHAYTDPPLGQMLRSPVDADAIPQTFAYLMVRGKQRWVGGGVGGLQTIRHAETRN